MRETNEWFALWFNTPEYHTLYGHRDEDEARVFIENLIKEFFPFPSTVLDAGCGAGRHVHSWALNGYDAVGFDLSINSIESAIARAEELGVSDKTSFKVLDLRDLKDSVDYKSSFDIVTNLFTSFGYFPKKQDHIDVLKGFSHALKKGGTLVFDYLNATYSADRIVTSEVITRSNIQFCISRKLENGFFKKTISYLNNDGKHETHTELVQAWTLQELTDLLISLGLQVKTVFGDYDLSEYQSDSPRLLIIAEKV